MKYVLTVYNRNIKSEEMIEDLKNVAKYLEKDSLLMEEYKKYGKYHPSTICRRFGNWNESLEKADLNVLSSQRSNIANEKLIDDLLRVSKLLNSNTVLSTEYSKHGIYDKHPFIDRFGNWDKALKAAGLQPTGYFKEINNEDLLNEIGRIWMILGKQPTANDIRNGVSIYSLNTFCRHFRGWQSTLQTFVNFIENDDVSNDQNENVGHVAKDENKVISENVQIIGFKRKSNREINLRIRFIVYRRDHFSCKICGASPSKNPAVELHIDHIVPWSKGGETVVENLQTLCSKCNYGKSDLDNDLEDI